MHLQQDSALRQTLLAQQIPFSVRPWSLHVPSHRFSGLLHTTYRPWGQLAKQRAPAESEQRLALGIFLSPNSPFPVAFSAASPQGRGALEVIKETGALLLWDFSAATSEIIPQASRYVLRPAKEHSEL